MSSYQKIYAAVKKIPKGKVATYGQIAEICNMPRQARQVGYALNALKDDSVPWQRVINAKGEISERPFADKQRVMLEEEGVVFEDGKRVNFNKFCWKT